MDEHAARRLRCFAEEAGRGLRGLEATLWRDRIEGRYQALEAAFDWLLDHGQADDALAMASTLAEFLRITGRVATGRRWLDRAQAATPADDRLRAAALYEHGMLAFWQGADEDACSLHGRSLQLARQLGDPTITALALCGLARVALREDLDRARTLCQEALQTVEATDDQLGRANALHVLGVAAQMQGHLELARDLMTRRIEAARQFGDFAAVASECANLSVVERQLGHLGRAEQLAMEALRIEERRGDEWAIPYSLNGLAAIAVETARSSGRPRCWLRPTPWSSSRATPGRRTRHPTSNAAARPSPPRSTGDGSSEHGRQATSCHRPTRCVTPSHSAPTSYHIRARARNRPSIRDGRWVPNSEAGISLELGDEAPT
jgi:tetratricopeptide (TPR) repeat protein